MQRHHASQTGVPAAQDPAQQDFIKADDDATGSKIRSDQAGDHGEKRHKQNGHQGEHHSQAVDSAGVSTGSAGISTGMSLDIHRPLPMTATRNIQRQR